MIYRSLLILFFLVTICPWLEAYGFTSFQDEKSLRAWFPNGSLFDAGTVDRGAIILHRFTITNPRTQPVTLKIGHPSCSCTTARLLGGKVLRPKERRIIEVGLNTSRGGERRGVVPIEISQPKINVILEIRATISNAVEILPEKVSFGQLHKGDTEYRMLRIRHITSPKKKLSIRAVEPQVNFLRVVPTGPTRMVRKISKVAAVFQQDFKVIMDTNNVPEGHFWSEIYIEELADGIRMGLINVPVKCVLLPDIRAIPSTLFVIVRTNDERKKVHRLITFEFAEGIKPVGVAEVRCTGIDDLSWTGSFHLKSEKSYRLEISFPVPRDKKFDSAIEIDFKIGDKKDFCTVTVPIRIIKMNTQKAPDN